MIFWILVFVWLNCPALQSEVGGSEISNYTLAMPGGSAIATFFLCRVGLILQNIGGSNLTTFFVCRPIFLQIVSVSVLLALDQYICRIKEMQTIPLQTKAARLSFSPYLKFFELDLFPLQNSQTGAGGIFDLGNQFQCCQGVKGCQL